MKDVYEKLCFLRVILLLYVYEPLESHEGSNDATGNRPNRSPYSLARYKSTLRRMSIARPHPAIVSRTLRSSFWRVRRSILLVRIRQGHGQTIGRRRLTSWQDIGTGDSGAVVVDDE